MTMKIFLEEVIRFWVVEKIFGARRTGGHTPAEISTPKFRQKRVFGPIWGTFEVSGGYGPSRGAHRGVSGSKFFKYTY